jgi:flagellar basal body-associated protein FliL
VILLVLILLGGTASVLLSRRPAEGGAPAEAAESEAIFTGIGRIRFTAEGAAENAAGVISFVFPYNAQDTPFSEELNLRTGALRSAAAEYLSSLSSEELRALDDEALKEALLARLNRALFLGRIETLYIDDFMLWD